MNELSDLNLSKLKKVLDNLLRGEYNIYMEWGKTSDLSFNLPSSGDSTMAYKAEEVAVIEAAAAEHGTITFDMAQELAVELCKTPRSVIAKVKQMDLPYEPKPKTEPKRTGPTKAELVAKVAENIGVEPAALNGLTKATVAALNTLVNAT